MKILTRCLCILLIIPLTRAADLNREVDIGGYKLHIQCVGEGHPTVILEHGLGGSSADWVKVQQNLAMDTQTCVYDRAGYGKSDTSPRPRTSDQIAAELRTLLQRAAIPPPYILAGHSFGGYTMRMFSHLYPNDTAGLVLVDSPHENQLIDALNSKLFKQIDPQGMLEKLWQPEIMTLIAPQVDAFAPLLGFTAPNLRSIFAELAGFQESSKVLTTVTHNTKVPLVIIHHGKKIVPDGQLGNAFEREWNELQNQLAEQYPDHRFLIARDSAHNIPVEQPELIVHAIETLLP